MPAGLSAADGGRAGRVFLTSDAVGGVWQYGLELTRGLRREGVAVTLAVLGPSPSPAQRAEAEAAGAELLDSGLPLEWTAESPEALCAAGRELAGLCRRSGAELAHLHNAAFAEADWPVPVVATLHSCVATWWDAVKQGPLPPDLAWRAERIRAGLAAMDLGIAPTAAFAAQLRRVYGLALPNLAVVHNGRAPAAVAERRREPVALTVGRLWDEAKNAATLDAAAGLLERPLLAAGALEGPGGQRFEPRHLQALGSLAESDLADCMAAGAVFVSPALYEPFGLAAVEAARAGMALVLSDTPGFRELWGEAALYVPARDAEAIAAAVARLLAVQDERQALAGAARRRAARYAPERMVADTLQLYRRALAGTAAGVAA